MKKFAFSLDRVLAWRRMQAHKEEIELERLRAGRRGLEARRDSIEQESLSERAGLMGGIAVTGSELEALDRYRRFAAAQSGRLDVSIREMDRKIGAQIKMVSDRRRDVRLVERLREEKFRKWRVELDGEVQRQAEESYLAKRHRRSLS